MCRILSISGKIKEEDIKFILQKFQYLAEYGNVAKGLKRGHKDGWGIMAYKNNKAVAFVRNYKSAFGDPKYPKAIKNLQEIQPNIIIGHLRRASVGIKSIRNTQPFVNGKYSFCQNGTIFNSKTIKLKNYFKSMAEGETDSEKLFLYILQLLVKDKKVSHSLIRMSVKKAVNYIRKNFDFTALNMILSDGKYIWVLREVNEKNEKVKQMKMMDYYSLFTGIHKDYQLIVSEKLDVKGVKWKEIYNHELIEIDLMSRKFRKFTI